MPYKLLSKSYVCRKRIVANIKLGSFRFGSAADLESLMFGHLWVHPNRLTPGFSLLPALTNIKPDTKTCTYLNRTGFSVGGTQHISNLFFHVPYKLLSKSAAPPNLTFPSFMFIAV